jgi:hypothetical protein
MAGDEAIHTEFDPYIVGLRNELVHEYGRIQSRALEIVDVSAAPEIEVDARLVVLNRRHAFATLLRFVRSR